MLQLKSGRSVAQFDCTVCVLLTHFLVVPRRRQSAYRRFHSTKTAVTKVVNDLLLAADSGQKSALCLLDLTAAFDTVDHELLISQLERQFGLRGVVFEWFRS